MPVTIKEYLVSLGWDVKPQEWRKFDDFIRLSTAKVEKYAKSMAKDFSIAGGVVATSLAAIAGGTVGLLASVAKQDLAYQLLARRMYMGVDATKKMKMATDALGYSLEEIIWGPPELAERYRQLIKDQDNMFRYLGSDGGEKAFRQIRDIGFQFTRMEPALKIFGMRLTEDILNKLTGSPASLEERLKQFVDWFESPAGFVHISDVVSTSVVPVLRGMGRVLEWIANLDYSKMWASFKAGFADLQQFMAWAKSDNKWGLLWDKDKGVNQNLNDLLGTGPDQLKGNIMAAARARGMDPAHALALFDQESGFDPNALGPAITNPKSRWFGQRAQGLGQVMPGNAPGKNLLDPDVNIGVTLDMLQQLLKNNGGDWQRTLNQYYGTGTPMPGQPTFQQYWQQYNDKYQRYQKEFGGGGLGAYDPTSYNTDVGGVTINITQPGATPDQIKKAVVEAIAYHERRKASNMYSQRQGVMA